MSQENKRNPLDRLNYSGSLEPVIARISNTYGIGKPESFSTIGVGYEDCNVIIETEQGKYVAKMFEKGRTQEDTARYGVMMGRVMEADVRHPPILPLPSGGIIYTDGEANGLSLFLMKLIEGKTFFGINRAPNVEELRAIIEQAAKINNIDYHPSPLLDSWSIPNIHVMFDRVKQFIQSEDLRLVEDAIRRYDSIPVDDLPHCFVHGDFTKANLIKGDDGDIYVLDFSVANWYPRIQELAVIAASLLHDPKSAMSLREKTEIVAEEYSRLNPLTPEEQKYLYDYALADYAMKFMGSHQDMFINENDAPENEYWFNLGREGLRRELT